MVDEVRDEAPARAGPLPRHRRSGPTTTCHDPGVTLARAGDAGRSTRTTRSTSSTPPAPPGFPKGATLSHRNILNNGYFVTELINFTEEDRLCIPVPFYHCFGMVMGNLGCTTHGATMVIPAPGFDPEITLRTIQDERCTGVYGVPTMFIAMQNHPDFADVRPVASLRTGIMAGSICPVEVMKRCVDDMHMAEVVDRLRHDRDLAGVDPDPRRRRPRAAYGDHRPGPPARRDQGGRPRRPARPSSAGEPGSSAPAATR